MVRIVVSAVLLVLTIACAGNSESPTAPDTITVPVRMTSSAGASSEQPTLLAPDGAGDAAVAAERNHLRTHMTGAEEVPVRDTAADGTARFMIDKDGNAMRFTLNVANIDNVTQAHIHVGEVGVNGGIVVWLYPSAPPAVLIPGRSNGQLSEGVITAASLVGPLAGGSLNDLFAAMRQGTAYVNVHTSLFPPGEIRGQIRRCGWVAAGC